MTLDKINEYVYAFRFEGEEDNELSKVFDLWNDTNYLHEFFSKYILDLSYFKVNSVRSAIEINIRDSEKLEEVFLEIENPDDLNLYFIPLNKNCYNEMTLPKSKAKGKSNLIQSCWLRIYAIKLESNYFVITGGAIKLTRTMQEREHTFIELNKLETCRNFLLSKNVFDLDSFTDYIKE